jgi:hypothetical protein
VSASGLLRPATGCTAAGVTLAATRIETWHGTRWSRVTAPSKPFAVLAGVACVADACTAAGDFTPRQATAERALVETGPCPHGPGNDGTLWYHS